MNLNDWLGLCNNFCHENNKFCLWKVTLLLIILYFAACSQNRGKFNSALTLKHRPEIRNPCSFNIRSLPLRYTDVLVTWRVVSASAEIFEEAEMMVPPPHGGISWPRVLDECSADWETIPPQAVVGPGGNRWIKKLSKKIKKHVFQILLKH